MLREHILICLSAFLLEMFSTHDWMLVLQLTVIPCVNVFIHTHSCSLFFDYRSGVTISALHSLNSPSSSSVAVGIVLCVSAEISQAADECEDTLISLTSLALTPLTEMDPSENIVTMATADRCAASLYNIFIKTNDVNSELLIGWHHHRYMWHHSWFLSSGGCRCVSKSNTAVGPGSPTFKEL